MQIEDTDLVQLDRLEGVERKELGFRKALSTSVPGVRFRLQPQNVLWEFPKIRGTLFWGPYNKDVLY